MDELNEIELKILYYIFHSGPVFTKKIASRLHINIHSIHDSVRHLSKLGYLERVTKTLIDYRIDKRNKVIKHRNHTYFNLTRKGRLLMRNFKDKLQVNLRPPYKQI